MGRARLGSQVLRALQKLRDKKVGAALAGWSVEMQKQRNLRMLRSENGQDLVTAGLAGGWWFW